MPLHLSAFFSHFFPQKYQEHYTPQRTTIFTKRNFLIHQYIQKHTFPETPKTPIFQLFIMPLCATFIPKSDKNAHETHKILSASLVANVKEQTK